MPKGGEMYEHVSKWHLDVATGARSAGNLQVQCIDRASGNINMHIRAGLHTYKPAYMQASDGHHIQLWRLSGSADIG